MLLHGRGGHKDKYKDKDTDKYKVLQRPNVCYIFEEQGVLGEDVRTVDMVDMNMADMEDMDMMDMDMLDMDIVDMDMVDILFCFLLGFLFFFCTCLWHCLKGVSEAHRSRKLTVKDKKTTAVQVYEYTHSCTILSYWSSASFFGVPTINSKSKKIAQTGHYLQSMAFNPEYSLFRRNMK